MGVSELFSSWWSQDDLDYQNLDSLNKLASVPTEQILFVHTNFIIEWFNNKEWIYL